MVYANNPAVKSYKQFFVTVFIVVVVSIVTLLCIANVYPARSGKHHEPLDLSSLDDVSEVTVASELGSYPVGRNTRCSHYDCFNIYRCGFTGLAKVHVYVYPIKKYVDDKGVPIGTLITKEYYRILKTIQQSEYYTSNPDEACVFVPSIDTLNQNYFRPKEVSQALNMLPYWNGGENHLIWNMIPGSAPDYSNVVELSTGSAMIAGAGFDSWSFRLGFDISLPVYSILAESMKVSKYPLKRKWLVISSQGNIHSDYVSELEEASAAAPDSILLLEPCPLVSQTTLLNSTPKVNRSTSRCIHGDPRAPPFPYPEILMRGEFCLVIRGARLGQPSLLDAMAAGCIPIVASDNIVMPFADVIDWRRAVLTLGESELGNVIALASQVSDGKKEEMRQQVKWLYEKYFSSVERLTNTVLEVLNTRVYPHTSPTYDMWNNPPNMNAVPSPLVIGASPSKWQGFTAVILTYDRVASLFTLVEKLSVVPSLSKLLVIWNNQRKSPPHGSLWPKVSKPLQVIQTKENKLSNRFYPYDEIETEAILTIDDDIVMLTSDELEFGYEVWREFPDRIVGFPSRTHVWDNSTLRWRYQSEWTNHISMVLTGAAFHHKYWSYMYTTSMPGDIKDWVDQHMNCEDIAMNFLVANVTSKAPIKVTPRKKFKCPECINTEMLSADLNHMMERSRCIDKFASIYGTMPLRSVEFRADPVLYRDPFPTKLKRFNNIGTL